MPHKHKRKRDDDTSNFDLGPNTRAKPLAAYNKASIFSKDEEATPNKRRKSNSSKFRKSQDDTPKAFARLMAWQATGRKPNGLDNGTTPKSSKKKERKPKQNTSEPLTTTTTTVTSETAPTPTLHQPPPSATPKILPGESLSTFSLRVDQSLPLTSIPNANKTTTPAGTLPADLAATLKKHQRTTKHNKRLQKMQADWRATEAKLQEKEADEADDNEERREEEELLWSGVTSAQHSTKGKKKRAGGGTAKGEDDPWKDLEKKRREETKQKNLQDVVKAPPVLKKVKSKFKPRVEDFDALDGKERGDAGEDEEVLVDVSNVPNAVGSLRRREELNATRRAVIEGYRNLQRGKKRGVGERLSMSRAIMT